MPVIADINAQFRKPHIEDRISEIARAEIEFFPKSGRYVRDVSLPVFPEIRTVIMDYGGNVVENALQFPFIDGNDQHHTILLSNILHRADRGAAGNLFRRVVPASILFRAEVWTGEDF